MPGGDGTGPGGMGPMTGRAAGYCAGYGVPGFANPIGGRGYGGWGRGRGGGGGWGRRNMFYATGVPGWQRFGAGNPAYAGGVPYGGGVSYGTPYGPVVPKEQELSVLKSQAEYFTDALEDIKKRIGELEAKPKEQ